MNTAAHIRASLLTLLLASLFAAGAHSQAGADTEGGTPAVPALTRYATDLTGTLTSGQLADLESLLSSFDRTTSTQVVVLMVPTLSGEDLEGYSLRVVEANRIGKKGKDNGVLLLVARNDRKVRIEVGYGLEGVLPDALAGQIVRREIAPHFRAGDYYGGLRAGAEAIMAATKDEYKAEPPSRRGHDASPLIAVVIFIAVALMRIVGRRRRFFGGPWIGGGWGSGGGFGGGFGGGSFSGGGFSGGGGSFGGGGASGGW